MAIAMCVDDYLLGMEDPTLSADLDSYIEVLEVYDGKRQLGVEHYQLGCLIGGKVCSTDPSNWVIGLEEAGDNIFVRFWNWLKALFTKFGNWIKSLFSSKNGETNAFSKPASFLNSRCNKILELLKGAGDKEIKIDFSKEKEKYVNLKFISDYLAANVVKTVYNQLFADLTKYRTTFLEASIALSKGSKASAEMGLQIFEKVTKDMQDGKKAFEEKLAGLKDIAKFFDLDKLDPSYYFTGTVQIRSADGNLGEFGTVLEKVHQTHRANEYADITKKAIEAGKIAQSDSDLEGTVNKFSEEKKNPQARTAATRAYMDFASLFAREIQKYAGGIRRIDAKILQTVNFIGKSVMAITKNSSEATPPSSTENKPADQDKKNKKNKKGKR